MVVEKKEESIEEIAKEMINCGLDVRFVNTVVKIAQRSEGTYDLMVIWKYSDIEEEKNEILVDLQNIIDDVYSFDDKFKFKIIHSYKHCDALAKEIIWFKKELFNKVKTYGGLFKLSKDTGIPIPYLKYFFNSTSIPKQITLHRIFKVLPLSEDLECKKK